MADKVKIYLSKLPYELIVQIHRDIEKNKPKEKVGASA